MIENKSDHKIVEAKNIPRSAEGDPGESMTINSSSLVQRPETQERNDLSFSLKTASGP